MCGIATILSPSDVIPDVAINRMVAALFHRGPDDHQIQTLPGCHLGHTRLSVIDIEGGTQPMADKTGRYWIVFNGEIYNYRELRRHLEQEGFIFNSRSDTEVLLTAWIRYGDHVFEYLWGQFAFLIWDTRDHVLFGGRDRFGEKPLYYAAGTHNTWLAASELKAILASDLVSPQLDLGAVDAYLGLMYVPPHRTIYRNIHVLPPAHAIRWENGQCRIWRYWQPQLSINGSITEPEAIHQARLLIERAVQRQMIADVPVGAFLSGGLDSSTIVALMSRHTSHPIKTFSVGFGGLINELPYARAVSRQYRTEHHEIQMDIDLGYHLLQMATVYDEPFADSSNIPTYLLSEYTRREVKVVLSGDGGDELFGGYGWYDPLRDSMSINIDKARRGTDHRVFSKRDLISTLKRNRLVRKARFMALTWAYTGGHERHLAHSTRIFRNRSRWWSSNLTGGIPHSDTNQFYAPDMDLSTMDQATLFDLNCYLPGDILVKVDRAAMAHGLETRAPFLDPELVEFVLGLPWQIRFGSKPLKHLLRAACGDLWPESIINRPKQGFGAPIRHWLKHPDVQDLWTHVTHPESALNFILAGAVKRSYRVDPQSRWTLLCLGLWLDKHPACLHPQEAMNC